MATRTGIGRGTTSGGDLLDDHDSPRLQTSKPGRQSHRPEEQDSDAKRGSYATFYNALRELREVFHRIGQFDDANAKLDEMCKLLVLRVLDARRPPASATTKAHVFMANSRDLGFRVVSRAGASVKQVVGPCGLEAVTATYRKFRDQPSPSAPIACISRVPSIAAVSTDRLLNNRWTRHNFSIGQTARSQVEFYRDVIARGHGR